MSGRRAVPLYPFCRRTKPLSNVAKCELCGKVTWLFALFKAERRTICGLTHASADQAPLIARPGSGVGPRNSQTLCSISPSYAAEAPRGDSRERSVGVSVVGAMQNCCVACVLCCVQSMSGWPRCQTKFSAVAALCELGRQGKKRKKETEGPNKLSCDQVREHKICHLRRSERYKG